MKRVLGAVLLVAFLNGCAGLPLISTIEGSLSINGAVGLATGKYEHQAASALINMASHKSTGKTVSEHLYTAVETGWTKNTMEKHFPNKKLTITDFKILNKSLSDFGGFLKCLREMGKLKGISAKRTRKVHYRLKGYSVSLSLNDHNATRSFSNIKRLSAVV